jgi:hypothetical protein
VVAHPDGGERGVVAPRRLAGRVGGGEAEARLRHLLVEARMELAAAPDPDPAGTHEHHLDEGVVDDGHGGEDVHPEEAAGEVGAAVHGGRSAGDDLVAKRSRWRSRKSQNRVVKGQASSPTACFGS